MTQQIINTGAANDGTGESLRNAFIAVNDNFTQIWAAGPVDSQVVITNNVISTNVTNLPLVLAANGIATINLDSTTIPSIDSVYDLGSTTKRFDSVHSQYFYGNGRFLTGISGGGGGGSVTFSNTAPLTPNVGDVWIQSNTAVQFIYFNDNNSNQWAELEAYQSFGSSSNSGNGNVNFESVESDIIPSANNGYSLGNASQQWNNAWLGNTLYIKTIPLTVSNTALTFNGESVLTTGSNLRFANLSVTGNITTNAIYTNNYFYANGAPFAPGANVIPNSSIRITGNTISTATLNQNLTLAGNGIGSVQTNSTIIPGIDAVYDIGTPALRMDTVYARYFVGNGSGLTGITATANTGNWGFTGNTMYDINGGFIDNSDLSHGATAYLSIPANGNTSPVSILNYYGNFVVTTANAPSFTKSWTFDNTGNITLPTNAANINYANGVSILNGVSGSYSNANVAAYLPTYTGDITANIISVTGNITANYFIGNGSQLTGISSSGNVDFTAVASNIIPTGNSVYNLGNAAHQWGSLYLSNATIYMDSVPISLTAGNVLTVDGQDVVTTNSEGVANIGNLQVNGSTIALVSGASQTQVEISPNGESWAYLQIPNDATGNVANVRMHNDAGNIEIAAGDTTHGGAVKYWYLKNNGEMAFPDGTLAGNIEGNNTFGFYNNNANTVYLFEANANAWSLDGANSVMTFPWGANINSIDSGNITYINSASGTPAHPTSLGLRAYGNTANMPPLVTTSLNSADARLEIHTYNVGTDTTYDWQFDDGGSLTLPNAPGNIYFGGISNQPVIIPGATAITLNADRGNTTENYLTVSQDGIELFSVNSININNSTTGFTNSDINLLSGDDIKLQGRDRPADEEREGGDLFIYGGNGSDASNNTFDAGGGGDLLIEAGLGGAGTGTGANGGSGGQVSINAGNGGTTVDAVAGSGGGITITAGAAATPVDPAAGGWGGDVTIRAGETTRVNEIGGSITLWTGGSSGGGTGAAGFVEINIPSSNVGAGGSWTFTGTGKTLQVPADSEIYGASYGNFTVGCAGNTIVTSSDYGINPQNWVFGYTGILTVPGEGVIQSLNDTVILQSKDTTSGNVYSARLGTTGGLYFETTEYPQGWLNIVNNAGNADINAIPGTGGAGGKNININAGAADQSNFFNTPGGNVNITGGLGASNDGGGGGPGGSINIIAGNSADPAGHAGNINIATGTKSWNFGYTGTLGLPGITTTTGAEAMTVTGTRTLVGGFDNPSGAYAATFTGSSPVAVYSCDPNTFSAKVTFAIQTNYVTFGWEQFDVSVIKLQAGGVGVTVSNRMNGSPANGDTAVTATLNGSSIEISLTQPGTGTAYVNYNAVEFKLPVD